MNPKNVGATYHRHGEGSDCKSGRTSHEGPKLGGDHDEGMYLDVQCILEDNDVADDNLVDRGCLSTSSSDVKVSKCKASRTSEGLNSTSRPG